MLDLLDRVPAPQRRRLRVAARQMARIGDELVRQDRGEMFEAHRRGQAGYRRSALRDCEHAVDLGVERVDIVALVDDVAVERDVLAGVDHLLLRERRDFGGQARRGAIAEFAHAVDEEPLPLREGDGERVVEGGGDRIVVQPPAPVRRAAAEPDVARRDRQVGGSLCVHGPYPPSLEKFGRYLHECQ